MAGCHMSDAAEMKRKHLFIINPVSFRTEADMNTFMSLIREQFEGIIKAEYDIYVSRFPRYAIRRVRQYILREEPETAVRVYAVGGDGILFDCLNGIVGLPNAELVPVPYGYTNNFIRAFGDGHEDLFRDIPRIAAAPTVPTDILHCGSNYALNLCLVGLESSAAFKTGFMQRSIRSWSRFFRNNIRIYNLLYYLGGFMVLFDQRLLRQKYTVSIDGDDLSGAYAGINIANGPCYAGDKSAVVTAVPNDGFMDVLMLHNLSTLRGLRMILPYTHGYYKRFPGHFTLKQGKIISIRSRDPLMINMDGEFFFDTNITVELLQGAIKIVVPDNLVYQKRGAFYE
jgi:diacylglycerol kinase family enzyme